MYHFRVNIPFFQSPVHQDRMTVGFRERAIPIQLVRGRNLVMRWDIEAHVNVYDDLQFTPT